MGIPHEGPARWNYAKRLFSVNSLLLSGEQEISPVSQVNRATDCSPKRYYQNAVAKRQQQVGIRSRNLLVPPVFAPDYYFRVQPTFESSPEGKVGVTFHVSTCISIYIPLWRYLAFSPAGSIRSVVRRGVWHGLSTSPDCLQE